VKPQIFVELAAACAPYFGAALQPSAMVDVKSSAIARASGSTVGVRTMPNTPALFGRDRAGHYALPAVTAAESAEVEAHFSPTGQVDGVPRDDDLAAVTALSGSDPAHVFYVLEAVMQATAQRALAAALSEAPDTPWARVTSMRGPNHAVISATGASGANEAVVSALTAAQVRAGEFGREAHKPSLR